MSEERFEDCPIAVNEKDYERHKPVGYYHFYINSLNSYTKNEIINPNGVEAKYGVYGRIKKE
jgi:hypothetical protein